VLLIPALIFPPAFLAVKKSTCLLLHGATIDQTSGRNYTVMRDKTGVGAVKFRRQKIDDVQVIYAID